MCGIVAIFSERGPVSAETLRRATQRIVHRGPDGQRHWIASDGRVGLGHARLSIIDLVTGDQPIANEDETLRIVANGEFYEFEAIRRELEQRGHRFRTRSDSEIALHLYEEAGSHALSRLRGEFAFVIWDEPNQTLLAARDRFGVKPLYWARVGETLYLASEAKALFAAGVPARWDAESFYQSIAIQFDEDRSMFAGVSQVPPGCFLLATPGHQQIVRYWDVNYPLQSAAESDQSECDDRQHVERMRAALDEAVRIRLRADVPVGCYLSGGIDSCAILGFASRHHAEPIKAFTLCFDTAMYNEEAVAREMAEAAGAEFYPLSVTQEMLADHFADAVEHAEIPTANPHGVAKYLLSELVRERGYKVVLTGEGSDEMLGGYAHFRRDMLLYNSQNQDPESVNRLLRELEEANEVSRGLLLPTGNAEPLESVKTTLGFVPSWLETRSANGVRYRRLLRPEFCRAFEQRDAFRVFLNRIDVAGQLAGREPVHQSLYLWTRSMLPNYLLNFLGDRMEMAHSIEGRVPFLDHHLVETIRDMPVRMKIRGMTEKYVLREAAREVLTETVYRRQKHPFLAPPAGLQMDGRLFELMQDTLRGPALKNQPFYDPQAVLGLLDRMKDLDDRKRSGASYLLTNVMSTCILHERYALQS